MSAEQAHADREDHQVRADHEHRIARNRLIAAITVVAGVSLGGALGGLTIDRHSILISAYFLATQDAPVLWLFVVFLAAAGAAFVRSWAPFGFDALKAREVALAWLAIIVGCGVIWAGTFLVYRQYALSIDEFMAEFDAKIIATGRLFASVPPEWRPDVPALQPIFRLEAPGNAYWVSAYLPMNAAIRALFVLVGAPAWEGIALAGLAMLALLGVARQLWPDRPDAALAGVLLLGCSSQFLVTAMTPYAMTAHLAFNMAWLWLFLRGTRLAHLAAAAVAFVACGLHQLVFHPLFAAPFVLSLVVARRWTLAVYYIAVYALVGLFWVLYWSLVLPATDASMMQSADAGMLHFVQHVAGMLDISIAGFVLMVLNLFRFLAWQSPLVVPLALVGLLARGDHKTTMVCLAAGIALTLAVVQVLIPFQGHGWGYRYLHGFLGSLALMAAQGWIRLTGRGAQTSRTAAFALALNVLVAVAVLLPWRVDQVRAFIAPYATSVAAIERSGADVVIVDPTGIWYGEDLVRNDPFLRASPKVLSLPRLDPAQLRDLCGRYTVAIFDRDEAKRLGIRSMQSPPEIAKQNQSLRTLMQSLHCGHPVLRAGS